MIHLLSMMKRLFSLFACQAVPASAHGKNILQLQKLLKQLCPEEQVCQPFSSVQCCPFILQNAWNLFEVNLMILQCSHQLHTKHCFHGDLQSTIKHFCIYQCLYLMGNARSEGRLQKKDYSPKKPWYLSVGL